MARRLLFLRHGEIGKQYHDRYVGSTDVSLSEQGCRQAVAVRELLKGRIFDYCVCSPMKRCRETAIAVMESKGIHIEIDQDLREIDFGQWEGMSFDEILRTSPDQVRQWAAFDPSFAFPAGEKIGGFLKRIDSIAGRMANDSADTILVCTHGGVIRAMICHFLKLKPWQYILFKVKPASVTTIELFDGGGILSGLSETGQDG